jgi:hypothetical protein
MALRLTAGLILAAVAAGVPAAAGAQTLQRLTVQSFVLSSDVRRPELDQPFHLVVALRVRERVTQIYNLELPMLAQLELLGDERSTVSGPRGTEYREVITVVAHTSGAIPISPAVLQARDARDDKPKQWYTNGLTLYAGRSTGQAIRGGVGAAFDAAMSAARFVLTFAVIAAVFGFLVWGTVKLIGRRAPPPHYVYEPQPVPEPVTMPRTRRQQVEDALLVLNAERTRLGAAGVRAAIWRMVGAPEGETLGDVLSRPGANENPLRDVLIALERSTFTYDADLNLAIADACAALERYAAEL